MKLFASVFGVAAFATFAVGQDTDCDEHFCLNTGLVVHPTSASTNAERIVFDATALSEDFDFFFEHDVIDNTSWPVGCGQATTDCANLCPFMLVTPDRVYDTVLEGNTRTERGIEITAVESYDSLTQTVTVTLSPTCYSVAVSGAREVATAASAFVLAAAAGMALLPTLPARFLPGSSSWRLVGVAGASLALVSILLASGNLDSESGGLANAMSSCTCSDTDGKENARVYFYHAATVNVNDGTDDINAGSAVPFSGGTFTVDCVGTTCFSPSSADCSLLQEWDEDCHVVVGRPLLDEDSAPVRAPVEWTSVARSALESSEDNGDAFTAVSWVPYLDAHLAMLDAAAAAAEAAAAVAVTAATTDVAGVVDASGLPTHTLSVDRWLRQGQDEHASVASFNRFGLSLMAHAAPASLVRRTQLAALDETKHAELSFSLAAALNVTAKIHSDSVWVPVPKSMPIPNPLPLDATTEQLQRAAFWEGCTNELVAAARASVELQEVEAWMRGFKADCVRSRVCVQAAAARDALAAIADEEAGHAVLAWKTQQWLLSLDAQPSNSSNHKATLAEVAQHYLTDLVSADGTVSALDAAIASGLMAPLYELASGETLQLPDEVATVYADLRAGKGGDSSSLLAGVGIVHAAVVKRW